MNQEPIFYQGQPVICVENNRDGTKGNKNPLIYGKRYNIDNPDIYRDECGIYVSIVGFPKKGFLQESFVPEDFNKEADKAISEMLTQEEPIKI